MNHCLSPLFEQFFYSRGGFLKMTNLFALRYTVFKFDPNLFDRKRKIGFILFVKFFNGFIVHLFVFLWFIICENEFSLKIFIFSNGFHKIIHMLVLPLRSSTSFFTSFKNFLHLFIVKTTFIAIVIYFFVIVSII